MYDVPVLCCNFQNDVDRSLKEANAQAGAGKPPQRDNWAYRILRVEAKNLNVAYELRRLFGPEEDPRR